ncbi:Hypothetical protein MVR_LOCUS47 [uncultured virus]|nr:Hypothetical protein MVR_LOCUS47 [uncultured virus]
MDYKWLLMCLHFDLNHVKDPDSCKYGFTMETYYLSIRSIVRTSVRGKVAHVITNEINVQLSNLTYRIGTFVDNIMEGNGIHITSTATYTGQFGYGYYNGLGTLNYNNGDSYHGHFYGDRKSGFGTQKYQNGSSYVGGWDLNEHHGTGSYYWPNGSSYVGQFNSNKIHGHGTHRYSDGSNYVGQFHTRTYHGLGTFTKIADNQVTNTYTGLWHDGVPYDCDFGCMFFQCSTCNVKICDKCLPLHSSCKTKQTWTHESSVVLNCNHESTPIPT